MPREESSLLFSLKELRTIEADRVRDEESARQARLAAEKAAREAELARVVAEQERRAQALRDAELAQQVEAERQARETALRLEEAERRARVEAQMRLEESRIKMEIEANAAHGARKKPVALIAIAGVLFLAVAGLGVFAYQKHQENLVAERQHQEAMAKLEAETKVLQGQIDELNRQNAEIDAQINAKLEGMAKLTADQAAREAEAIKQLQVRKGENTRRVTAISRQKTEKEQKGAVKVDIDICPKDKPMCKKGEH